MEKGGFEPTKPHAESAQAPTLRNRNPSLPILELPRPVKIEKSGAPLLRGQRIKKQLLQVRRHLRLASVSPTAAHAIQGTGPNRVEFDACRQDRKADFCTVSVRTGTNSRFASRFSLVQTMMDSLSTATNFSSGSPRAQSRLTASAFKFTFVCCRHLWSLTCD